MSFDGEGQALSIPASPELDPGDEFTIEAWVRPESNPENENILEKENSGEPPYGYLLADQHGRLGAPLPGRILLHPLQPRRRNRTARLDPRGPHLRRRPRPSLHRRQTGRIRPGPARSWRTDGELKIGAAKPWRRLLRRPHRRAADLRPRPRRSGCPVRHGDPDPDAASGSRGRLLLR